MIFDFMAPIIAMYKIVEILNPLTQGSKNRSFSHSHKDDLLMAFNFSVLSGSYMIRKDIIIVNLKELKIWFLHLES